MTVSITMSITVSVTVSFVAIASMVSVMSVSMSVGRDGSNDWSGFDDWSDGNNSLSDGMDGWGGFLNDGVVTMDGVSSVSHGSVGTVRVEDGVLACKYFVSLPCPSANKM